MTRMRIFAMAALAAASMACVPRREPPAPAPLPPAPAPPPAERLAPPPPAPVDWQDAPLSPGDWRYSESGPPLAVYRSDGLSLSLRCERSGTIVIGLLGAQAPGLLVRTTYGERRLSATAVHLNEMIAALPAADPLFDQMAFSRGRFMVQAGSSGLIVPAWPEIARVTEECRGQ